jgi:predicted SnoaL-like aldol condensation-catalyzing enzyme
MSPSPNSEYVNHSPNATSGRENALSILVPTLSNRSLSISRTTWFSGQGYGVLHYMMGLNGTSNAVMDKFRLQGTCVVEHWDAMQAIFGNETNPIAFF